MATNMHKSNIHVECLFSSPTKERLTKLFSDAILKGNAIHQKLFKASNHLENTNLTVPEAMTAAKSFLGTLNEWVRIRTNQYSTYISNICIGLLFYFIEKFSLF